MPVLTTTPPPEPTRSDSYSNLLFHDPFVQLFWTMNILTNAEVCVVEVERVKWVHLITAAFTVIVLYTHFFISYFTRTILMGVVILRGKCLFSNCIWNNDVIWILETSKGPFCLRRVACNTSSIFCEGAPVNPKYLFVISAVHCLQTFSDSLSTRDVSA